MSSPSLVKYKDFNDCLTTLDAVDKGRYFTCRCPVCGRHEGFIYKNNLRFVLCSRKNSCGERTEIKYIDQAKVNKQRTIYYRKQLKEKAVEPSLEQLEIYEWLDKFIKHLLVSTKSPALDNGYRGISRQVSENFIADLVNEKVVSFLLKQIAPLTPNQKDYSRISYMTSRNLLLPIYDENQMLDRIILRSSIDPSLNPKEIQFCVNPLKQIEDARDFITDIPGKASMIAVTEAIIDGLSFKEAATGDVGIISLTGVNRVRQVIQFFIKNKSKFENNNFLLALDNDEAGIEATKKIAIVLRSCGLKFKIFDYGTTGAKDPNELLLLDKEVFVKTIKKSVLT